jgi:sugar lactone lactonase YvrE
VEDLVTTGLSHPGEIALDMARSKMYWTDAGTGQIQRANVDGTGVEDLRIRRLSIPWAIALDVAGGKMYWTDVGSRKIQRANLDGTGMEDLVSTYAAGPVKGGGLRYGIALTTGQ